MTGCTSLKSHGLALIPVTLGIYIIEIICRREKCQRSIFRPTHVNQERGSILCYGNCFICQKRELLGNKDLITDCRTDDLAWISIVVI